jgi:NifU-like protein involved in Fe-S cluster formation
MVMEEEASLYEVPVVRPIAPAEEDNEVPLAGQAGWLGIAEYDPHCAQTNELKRQFDKIMKIIRDILFICCNCSFLLATSI